jgi:hypothetical protein
LDYEAFFSPAVLRRRAEYMHKHRVQPDGSLRDGDNWQKGMPLDVCMKSGFRHFVEWWTLHRLEMSYDSNPAGMDELEEALCAVMFNAEVYLHEILRRKGWGLDSESEAVVPWEQMEFPSTTGGKLQ